MGTWRVPPPPVLSQSSDTLTIVQGSDAFQWKSTTLSLNNIVFIRKKNHQLSQKTWLKTESRAVPVPSMMEEQARRSIGQFRANRLLLFTNLGKKWKHYWNVKKKRFTIRPFASPSHNPKRLECHHQPSFQRRMPCPGTTGKFIIPGINIVLSTYL